MGEGRLKHKRIDVRLSYIDHNMLKIKAKKHKKTISGYIRYLIMKDEILGV